MVMAIDLDLRHSLMPVSIAGVVLTLFVILHVFAMCVLWCFAPPLPLPFLPSLVFVTHAPL